MKYFFSDFKEDAELFKCLLQEEKTNFNNYSAHTHTQLQLKGLSLSEAKSLSNYLIQFTKGYLTNTKINLSMLKEIFAVYSKNHITSIKSAGKIHRVTVKPGHAVKTGFKVLKFFNFLQTFQRMENI